MLFITHCVDDAYWGLQAGAFVTIKELQPLSGVHIRERKHMDAEAYLTLHLSQMCNKFSLVCVSVVAGVSGDACVHVEARDRCWVSSSVPQAGSLIEPITH